MFVHDFMPVRRPFEQVSAMLAGSPGWVAAAARVAHREAMELHRDDVTGGAPGSLRALALPDDIRAVVGRTRHGEGSVVMPIVWGADAGGDTSLLEGDLEALAVGRSRTQLDLRARFEPPPGSLGRTRDDRLLWTVAQSAVRGFLGRVAATLELEEPAPAQSVRADAPPG